MINMFAGLCVLLIAFCLLCCLVTAVAEVVGNCGREG